MKYSFLITLFPLSLESWLHSRMLDFHIFNSYENTQIRVNHLIYFHQIEIEVVSIPKWCDEVFSIGHKFKAIVPPIFVTKPLWIMHSIHYRVNRKKSFTIIWISYQMRTKARLYSGYYIVMLFCFSQNS